MNRAKHRIVVTGAPASGKTQFVRRLKTLPEFADFIFFDELARSLLEQDQTYRERWEDFHLEIYRLQVEQEKNSDRSFITDRGTLDAATFFPGLLEAVPTTISREYARYTAVIQLGSSAGLGEMFYQADSIRNESRRQILMLEKATKNIWSNHPGYRFIEAEVDYESKRCKFEKVMTEILNGT